MCVRACVVLICKYDVIHYAWRRSLYMVNVKLFILGLVLVSDAWSNLICQRGGGGGGGGVKLQALVYDILLWRKSGARSVGVRGRGVGVGGILPGGGEEGGGGGGAINRYNMVAMVAADDDDKEVARRRRRSFLHFNTTMRTTTTMTTETTPASLKHQTLQEAVTGGGAWLALLVSNQRDHGEAGKWRNSLTVKTRSASV